MDEVRVELRDAKLRIRTKDRGVIQDRARGIDPSLVIRNEAEMKATAKKLSKSPTEEILLLLKNSLLLGTEFVHAFLDVPAALPKLVKLFYASGSNPKLQMLAGHCLVNMCLGEEGDCLIVAKQAGPYLVMQMEGTGLINPSAVVDAAHAIGNLSSHLKVATILRDQGAFLRVMKLIASDEETVSSAAVYCLTQALYYCPALFSPNEILEILEYCFKAKYQSSKMLFLVSLTFHDTNITGHLLSRNFHLQQFEALQKQLNLAEESMEFAGKDQLIHILILVRILANLMSEGSGRVVLELAPNFGPTFQKLASIWEHSPVLKKESSWMLANFLNHPAEQAQEILHEINLQPLLMDLLLS